MNEDWQYLLLIAVGALIFFSFALGIWNEGGDTSPPNPIFSFNV
ncbi:hypothetical protein [Alkalihalobacillus pseudalcaliphilus]|nr:hypothetical protein [Alkalihalobacillus pseudalcaliphilus]